MSNARAAALEALAHRPLGYPGYSFPPSRRPGSYGDALTEQYLASEHHGINKANARDTRRDISGNGSDLVALAGCVRLARRDAAKRGRASGVDDPKALLRLVYQQNQRSAGRQ